MFGSYRIYFFIALCFSIINNNFLFAQSNITTNIDSTISLNMNGTNGISEEQGDIKFTDGSNTLLRITDEGNYGAIELKTGVPETITNKLYNIGGSLYFNGNSISGFDINNLTDGKTVGNSIFLGIGAGTSQTLTNSYNVGVGDGTLVANTGYGNSAFGGSALHSNTSGNRNTALGYQSMYTHITGSYNNAIGYQSLQQHTSGANNTANGAFSLFNNLTGAGNVALGYQAGYNETGSNKLYIDNSSTSTPLIGGDFTDNEIYLNGDVGIGSTNPGRKLHVVDDTIYELAIFDNQNESSDSDGIRIQAGPIVNPGIGIDYISFYDGDGTYLAGIDGNGFGGVNYKTTSDARLKTNIKPFNGALKIVEEIKVRNYERKTLPGKNIVGLIAQEMQKVFPQVVSGSPNGDVETDPMGIDYGRLTPLLIKAVQELNSENNEYEIIIADLLNRVDKLESK